MNALASNTKFLFFPQLNELEDKSWLSSKSTFGPPQYENLFKGNSLQSKILKVLADAQLLPIKEVLECFEYFAQIRKHVRSRVMCDLCCGHGLLGVIFAVFEKDVEKVYLVDKVEPPSRQKLLSEIITVAPWIEQKIINVSEEISSNSQWLEEGMSIVSAHACGSLTDLCIDVAFKVKGNIAILPCCYPKKKCPAPQAIQDDLGFETAFDIDRTYRLKNADYHIRWQSIPAEISPMNRVIVGKKKG